MSSKQQILNKVRQALSDKQNRAPYPVYDTAEYVAKPRVEGGSAEQVFRRNFAAVHGIVVGDFEELKAVLAKQPLKKGCCDPALTAKLQGLHIEWESEFNRNKFDEYDIGVTFASGAVAETGSLMLKDRATADRLSALAPWVHVAVLKRSEIYLTLPEALQRLGDDPNVILVTGPSKTADVEGILIEGVHGPGVQIAWLVD
ncbi:MAG: lactate utilization protein [Verrucomicrobiales bacterium]|jgi:L-lactate dehydrogenase complex protein LldG|nr:lactate utilization protein [Verrucomicrobiales bacterium]